MSNQKLRDQVIRSIECLYYSSSIKDNREYIIWLIDSICVHITLISLAHYNNQNEQNVNNLIQSMNMLSNTYDHEHIKKLTNNTYLDFMVLVDALFAVLCNDDSEYWYLTQRSLSIIVETSQIVSNNAHSQADYHKNNDSFHENNLANLALFDYLVEKLSQLCYERSWYAKKAGCMMLKILINKMPLQWTLQQCFMILKSIFSVLVSVTGEVTLN